MNICGLKLNYLLLFKCLMQVYTYLRQRAYILLLDSSFFVSSRAFVCLFGNFTRHLSELESQPPLTRIYANRYKSYYYDRPFTIQMSSAHQQRFNHIDIIHDIHIVLCLDVYLYICVDCELNNRKGLLFFYDTFTNGMRADVIEETFIIQFPIWTQHIISVLNYI